jgi:hypothetical protein
MKRRQHRDPASAEALSQLRAYRGFFAEHRPEWVRAVSYHILDVERYGTNFLVALNLEGYEEERRRILGLPPSPRRRRDTSPV